ncbi:hypothetical protein B0H14DRAFT_2622105 [Mycena olivaceomarginata]|nr:hypothetical protein B0H14DRAFT_2622105 [Mycena olivaceomarginata]
MIHLNTSQNMWNMQEAPNVLHEVDQFLFITFQLVTSHPSNSHRRGAVAFTLSYPSGHSCWQGNFDTRVAAPSSRVEGVVKSDSSSSGQRLACHAEKEKDCVFWKKICSDRISSGSLGANAPATSTTGVSAIGTSFSLDFGDSDVGCEDLQCGNSKERDEGAGEPEAEGTDRLKPSMKGCAKVSESTYSSFITSFCLRDSTVPALHH